MQCVSNPVFWTSVPVTVLYFICSVYFICFSYQLVFQSNIGYYEFYLISNMGSKSRHQKYHVRGEVPMPANLWEQVYSYLLIKCITSSIIKKEEEQALMQVLHLYQDYWQSTVITEPNHSIHHDLCWDLLSFSSAHSPAQKFAWLKRLIQTVRNPPENSVINCSTVTFLPKTTFYYLNIYIFYFRIQIEAHC